MKKYVLILMSLVMVAVVFAACSNESSATSTSTTTTQSETTTDEDETTIYYDKKGNEYTSIYEIKYYDKHDNVYLYQKDGGDTYFLSSDGEKLDFDKCFVNQRGVFIYDKNGEFTMSETYLSATDEDDNIYYPASTVRWTEEGKMVTMFGFGDTLAEALLEDEED